MKKALVVVAVLALLVWVISWFRAPAAVATAGAQTWPNGLGTLESVEGRYPAIKSNAAAAQLTKLGSALPKSQLVDDFVVDEVARGEMTIGEPPKIADVAAIRDLLLREPIVWEREGGIVEVGNERTSERRAMLMSVARTLINSALAKARAKDATAWDDLHAVWNLAQSLKGQPQMMLQSAAFSMTRFSSAVAWKMPLPAPAWFAELQQRDDVQPLLEAFQYQAASYWKDDVQIFPTKFMANDVDHDRRIAEMLASEKRCDVSAPMNKLGVDLASLWRRAFRTRAEREATANAMRIREGKPIETTSRCSDGTWSYDGTTLRFSRAIATAPPDRPMPLELRIRRD